jgi:dTDP-4-dehydrorhamnose reductase
MKVLIFGGNGMLGHKLVQLLSKRFDVVTTTRIDVSCFERLGIFQNTNVISGIDIRKQEQIARVFEEAKPEVVVNAIGIVKQVPTAKNLEDVLAVNAIFPHHLETACERTNSRLIHISTDCVFRGRKGNYKESDEPDAMDLYGRSKQIGEVVAKNCLTIRTSILGRELGTSHGLLEWFLAQSGKTVAGFTEAIFSGFPTIVLAGIIADVIDKHCDLEGLFHVASEPLSKYDLLCLIRDRFKLNIKVEPSDEIKINRSLDSTLFRRRTNLLPPTWDEMIQQMYNDKTPYELLHEKNLQKNN